MVFLIKGKIIFYLRNKSRNQLAITKFTRKHYKGISAVFALRSIYSVIDNY